MFLLPSAAAEALIKHYRKSGIFDRKVPCQFPFNLSRHTHAHTHSGTLLIIAVKKNEIMPFAAIWMNLEIFILSEVRQKKNTFLIGGI